MAPGSTGIILQTAIRYLGIETLMHLGMITVLLFQLKLQEFLIFFFVLQYYYLVDPEILHLCYQFWSMLVRYGIHIHSYTLRNVLNSQSLFNVVVPDGFVGHNIIVVIILFYLNDTSLKWPSLADHHIFHTFLTFVVYYINVFVQILTASVVHTPYLFL